MTKKSYFLRYVHNEELAESLGFIPLGSDYWGPPALNCFQGELEGVISGQVTLQFLMDEGIAEQIFEADMWGRVPE